MGSFSAALDVVQRYLGVDYLWGGNDTNGVDCSGFTRAVYAAMGIDLPRVSFQQANGGQAISKDQAQPGDLVWWDLNGRNPGADHVGIYLGGGKVAEASSSADRVVIRNLWGNAQFTRYTGIDDRGASMGAGGDTQGSAAAAGTPAPAGPDYVNPISSQDSSQAFGSLGKLDEDDEQLLHKLYSFSDDDDMGETPDTVGPYNVARLRAQREMRLEQQGRTGLRQQQDEERVRSPLLDRPMRQDRENI